MHRQKCEKETQEIIQLTKYQTIKKQNKMKNNNMYEAPQAEIVELNMSQNVMEDPIVESGGW